MAWIFFAVAAGLGVLLRAIQLWPIEGFQFGYLLHAHSHTAFLGWVYNAFYALAVLLFLPPTAERKYHRLFWFTQIGMLGMLITFPFQGYARESIIFSSLHLLCSGVFAWKLLRQNTASPAARPYLIASFVFMFASAAGPLALGPLAAAGMRDTTWYPFSIYVYLHFQYNGWFICFLIAAVLQHLRANGQQAVPATRALPWLVSGIVLTLGISALWMQPPPWVRVASSLGGASQLVGWVMLLGCFRSRWRGFDGLSRALSFVAAAALTLKLLLQLFATLPAVSDLVSHRFVAIGFLHLIFLGVVTPMLLVFGLEAGWVRPARPLRLALELFAFGMLVTEIVLGYAPLAARLSLPAVPYAQEVLFTGSLALLLAVMLLAGCTRRQSTVVQR